MTENAQISLSDFLPNSVPNLEWLDYSPFLGA